MEDGQTSGGDSPENRSGVRLTLWGERLAGAIAFSVLVRVLPLLLLFAAAFLPVNFVYDSVFGVFPHLCRAGTPYQECYMFHFPGVIDHWSDFAWGAIAIGFGWWSGGRPIFRRIGVAAILVAVTMVLFHVVAAIAGWYIFVDTI